ncbi:MAG: DUF4105 domain-containing protein, partial [Candidatus Krumholzibacteria bacterium]|nr:DUF4105 domain-containing protein [Candidatus Krumholzibacteria bacterium]
MRFRKSLVVLAAVAVVTVLVVVKSSSTQPLNNRSWKLEHSVLPRAEFDGDLVHVRGIRNFSYQSAKSFTPAYYDKTFDLSKIESLWFVLSIFRPSRRGLAHPFLSFGFANGDYVSISVEARQESDESYSVLTGLFKRFEVIYVIGDERDLVATRAIQRDDQVYLYPIRTSPDKIRSLFVEMLLAANQLHELPEFYNTLTNNCTTRIHDHVNRIASKKIPGSWKILLPGYA